VTLARLAYRRHVVDVYAEFDHPKHLDSVRRFRRLRR
jgi:hypothetical protein